MTKLAILTATISRNAGGLFQSVRCLARALQEAGSFQVEVLAAEDAYSAADLAAWEPLRPQLFRCAGPRALAYAPQLLTGLHQLQPGAVRVDGLWMYPSFTCLQWHRRTAKPYLVAPRGMLDGWALKNSAWKKRIAGWLFQTAHLHRAACLHALCGSEARSFRAFGLNNPIAIIPNGIALSQFDSPPARSALEARYPVLQHRKRLLFLSRIHPKKGLPHLLRAWAASHHSPSSPPAAQPNDWVLVVAGPSEGGHEQEIKELATRLDICWSDARDSQPNSSPAHAGPAPSLLFVGPLYGEDKQVALAGADAFVLPSFSEGFSMAILEAAASSLPVLLTPECNFPELTAAGAAIEIAADATRCEAGLRRLFSLPEAARQEMGRRGRKLVERAYTWPVIAQQMAEVYRWVLGEGKQPACVVK